MKKNFVFIFFLLSIIASSRLFPTKTESGHYPLEWWKLVPREEAKPWEILPQDAKEGEVILSKRTELGILSNFAITPFELDGKNYASIEGFWQMMKYPDPDLKNDPRNDPSLHWPYTREAVSRLSGFEAKDAGAATKKNYETLDIKWISYQGERIDYKGSDQDKHYDLIFKATHAKVLQNEKVKDILLATGDLILKPDHHSKPDDTPAYRYYDILMKIRSDLRN